MEKLFLYVLRANIPSKKFKLSIGRKSQLFNIQYADFWGGFLMGIEEILKFKLNRPTSIVLLAQLNEILTFFCGL